MYDDILVPTDGSAAVDGAIEHALELATRFDATVHALYVVDTSVASGAGFGEDFGTDAGHVLDALREDGEQAVRTVADAAATAGVDCVTAVRDGRPIAEIVDYVSENDIDCIAMGTHGRTGLDRVLLGSTTERVVRRADVPVLTVRLHSPTE